MEKRPAKKLTTEIERTNNEKTIEIIDPVQRMNPFISFRYSYREVSSVGGKTYLKAKEKSFENGTFKAAVSRLWLRDNK